jgi:hypothetical protein
VGNVVEVVPEKEQTQNQNCKKYKRLPNYTTLLPFVVHSMVRSAVSRVVKWEGPSMRLEELRRTTVSVADILTQSEHRTVWPPEWSQAPTELGTSASGGLLQKPDPHWAGLP